MYDVAIIGAGMSGLAAGIRLAHFGQRVCILERHYTIGGLNSFYRLRGRDYDVGLHALTNFTPRGTRRGPLAQALRQLRLRREDLELAEQFGSRVAFPGVSLRFTNDFEVLRAEVADKFPREVDRFDHLVTDLPDYDKIDDSNYALSGRGFVEERIRDPLLREMLLCPLMWYGNARQHDMDLGQLAIMFRSIFLEGFARPYAGVRVILKLLVRRFRELGGELLLRSGVKRIEHDDNRAAQLQLEKGENIAAREVLSSAGRTETLRLCGFDRADQLPRPGRMTFVETISTLDCQPAEIDHDETIVFFNDSDTFHWCESREPCDVRTGVICSPNNYDYRDADGNSRVVEDGVIRVTAIANYEHWTSLDAERYDAEKESWRKAVVEASVRHVPDYRPRIVDHDTFTPRTIEHFTGHDRANVYGAEEKRLDGRTPLANVHLCGNDQGYVGIIGTMISGVSMANRLLAADAAAPVKEPAES